MLKIIDVSQWQGTIKWNIVKNYIDGVILRVGYGSDDDTQDDKEYAYNVAECKRLNIPTEGYLYSYAHTEAMARSEAAHALRLIKGTQIRRIWYDLEESRYGSYAVTCMEAFAEEIKAAGYEVGLYTYEAFYNGYMRGYTKYPIWIAKYSSKAPNIGTSFIGWQYTSGAQINGISGRVDCSNWYGTFATSEKKPSTNKTQVYRLYKAPEHIWTLDTNERDLLIDSGWTYEGIGWKSPVKGSPVYRYVLGEKHMYTKDANERKALAAAGWVKEGIAFRSHTGKAVPIYRLYNAQLDTHLWTKSKNELKALIKAGWTDEGIAFYGRK